MASFAYRNVQVKFQTNQKWSMKLVARFFVELLYCLPWKLQNNNMGSVHTRKKNNINKTLKKP